VEKDASNGKRRSRDTRTSGKPREESRPQHIRSILETVFRETGLEEQVRENRAVLYWEVAVGKDISRYARAAYVEKGTLWVEVNNSVRMHSLQMQEEDLRRRINQTLKQSGSAAGTVRQIRFRLMEST
jgi:predicted nucleic acid-binding Zn ribbon protein